MSLNVVLDPGGIELIVRPSEEPVLELGVPNASRTLNGVLTVGGTKPVLTISSLKATLTGTELQSLMALHTSKILQRGTGVFTPVAIYWFFATVSELGSTNNFTPAIAPVVPGTTVTYTAVGSQWRADYYPVVTGWLEYEIVQTHPSQLVDVEIKVS